MKLVWRLTKTRMKDTIQPRVWQWEWLCFCAQLNSAVFTQKINSSSGLTATNPKLILQGKTGMMNEDGFDLFAAISAITEMSTSESRARRCCAASPNPGWEWHSFLSMATQGILEPLPCGFSEPFLWYQPRVAAQPNPSRNSCQELLSGIPSSWNQCQPAWGCASPFPGGFSCHCPADISLFQFTKSHQIWNLKLSCTPHTRAQGSAGMILVVSAPWNPDTTIKGKLLSLQCTRW